MKIKQLIGLLILVILFTLIGAATKDLTTWNDWFLSWGIIFGIIAGVIVGMFLLLDRDPQEEIL